MWLRNTFAVLTFLAVCFEAADGLKNKTPETDAIIKAGGKILQGYADEALKNFVNQKKVVDDLMKQQANYPDVHWPADLFQTMISSYYDITKSTDAWSGFWKKCKTLEKAETYVEMCLEVITFNTRKPEFDLASLVKKQLQTAGTTFDGFFKTDTYKMIKLLGQGGRGLVYLVTKGDKEYAFKVISSADEMHSEKPSNEIPMHKALSAYNFRPDVGDGSFIPALIDNGPSSDPKISWLVMERFPADLADYVDRVKEPMLAENEIMPIIARTYHLLQLLHKAGFYHGDNGLQNWALKKGNKKVLLLYDFGETRDMRIEGEFGRLTCDLWRWVETTTELLQKAKTNHKVFTDGNLLMPKLKDDLRKVLWVRDVGDQYGRFVCVPLQKHLKQASYSAVKATLTAFFSKAEGWLELAKHGLKAGEQIHHWEQ